MKNSKNKPKFSSSYNLLATFFGVGNSRYAPGTLGSLAAIIVWVLFNNSFLYFNTPTPLIYLFWAVFLLLLYVAGADAAELYSKKTKSKDPSSIIIDEVVGQLTVLFLSYYFVADAIIRHGLININALACYLFISFVLFRIFDINKPSFIGVVDKKIKSGYGIMIDDLLAGLISAAIISLTVIMLSK